MLYAPRSSGVLPVTAAQYALQHVSAVLKPVMSCSIPKTRTLFALRARVVRGTDAQDSENGAAAGVAAPARVTVVVVAVAVAAIVRTAAATPAMSQTRLRMNSSM